MEAEEVAASATTVDKWAILPVTAPSHDKAMVRNHCLCGITVLCWEARYRDSEWYLCGALLVKAAAEVTTEAVLVVAVAAVAAHATTAASQATLRANARMDLGVVAMAAAIKVAVVEATAAAAAAAAATVVAATVSAAI